MDQIVEFNEVNFAYQEMLILKNVYLEIYPGEFIGIIGPNGGGKTTLLKLLLGFLKPNSGRISVFGESPSKTTLQHISYVPQTMRYDRDFPISVMEVVLSGLLSRLPWYGRFMKSERLAAFEALDKLGVADLSERSFGTLSGGQAQRVLIARALVSNPKILLLDEPTANVDSLAESIIYKILEELKGQVTILMVTHDLKTVIDRVERVLCVQHEVVSLLPQEVCEHFAFGLYHPPLKQS
jgi:zinc transport system ATP-binding protein